MTSFAKKFRQNDQIDLFNKIGTNLTNEIKVKGLIFGRKAIFYNPFPFLL
jgi:hypothetical protein